MLFKVRKPVRYSLSVQAQGDDPDNELFRLTADEPFRGFAVGHEVLPRRWIGGRHDPAFTLAGVLRRIRKVRHVVCERNVLIDHLVVLYTEDANPSEEKAG
jgi:hypothetical protein